MVPSPVTALVGRDHDIDEVVKVLEALGRRLTVLTGTGVLLDLELLEFPKLLRTADIRAEPIGTYVTSSDQVLNSCDLIGSLLRATHAAGFCSS
jgi:hypothetical protein